MSKTNDLIRLASRFEKKLAQEDSYSRFTPAVKKVVSDLVSFLKKIIDWLSKNEQANILDSFIALKGVSSNLEQWLSMNEISKYEFYNVMNLWSRAESLSFLDENSRNWIAQQLQTLEDQLSPGF